MPKIPEKHLRVLTIYVALRILLLITIFTVILAGFVFMTGCYMIEKGLVGQDVGLIITNSTPLALEIVENGQPLGQRLLPGEHLVVRVGREFENTTTTIHILAKAWSLDGAVFAGVTERTFYVSHHYSASEMSYSNNGRQSWIVRVSDLSR